MSGQDVPRDAERVPPLLAALLRALGYDPEGWRVRPADEEDSSAAT